MCGTYKAFVTCTSLKHVIWSLFHIKPTNMVVRAHWKTYLTCLTIYYKNTRYSIAFNTIIHILQACILRPHIENPIQRSGSNGKIVINIFWFKTAHTRIGMTGA